MAVDVPAITGAGAGASAGAGAGVLGAGKNPRARARFRSRARVVMIGQQMVKTVELSANAKSHAAVEAKSASPMGLLLAHKARQGVDLLLDSSDEEDDCEDYEDSDDEADEPVRVRVRTHPLPTEATGDNKLIVDLGYSGMRFGMCGESAPTYLRNRSGSRRDMITKHDHSTMDVDWESMEQMWNRVYDTELDLPADESVVSCTVSPYGPDSYAETLAELLFEELFVPSLYFAVPGVLALYALGRTTGVVIDSGTCFTGVLPIVDGYCAKHAVNTLPFGGRDITERFAVECGGVDISTSNSTAQAIAHAKEALCSFGSPPDGPNHGQEETFSLPDGSKISITPELKHACRKLPEAMFFESNDGDPASGLDGTRHVHTSSPPPRDRARSLRDKPIST